MASGSNTAEGLSNGTVPTTGNTGAGSGTAATAVTIASTDTITAATAAAAHQTLGYRMVLAAAGAGATRMFFPMVESTRTVFSFYVRIDSLPTAVEDLAGIRNSSGNMCVLQIGADGKLVLANAAGGTITASKSTATFPVNTFVRVDLAAVKGTGTTDGTLGYAYFTGTNDGANPVFSWESTAQNAGTTDSAVGAIGRSTGRTQAHTIDYDTIRWAATGSGWFDHYVVPGTPVPTYLFTNTAEGVPINATPSSGNTGGASGTPIDSIAIATGDGIVCSNFNTVYGNRGYAFSYLGPGAGATRMLWSVDSPDRFILSFYLGEISTLPTATEDLCGIRNATGNMGVLTIGADGKLVLVDAGGTGISASRSTAAIPVQQKLRVEMVAKKGTGTTDGTLGYAYFLASSTTPIFSYESPVLNAGTANVSKPFIGRSTGRAQANNVYYDTIRGATLTSGFLPQYVPPPAAPIVTLGPDIGAIEPFSIVTISALGSTDSDGTIVSYALTQTAGDTVAVTGTGPTWTYRAPGNATGQTLSFSMTATDDSGLTSTAATVNHAVLQANEFAVLGGILAPMEISIVPPAAISTFASTFGSTF